MDQSTHSLEALFDQLGLDSSSNSIDDFININGGIAKHIEIHDADCWTKQQAQTLKTMKENDADWAVVVDELNVRMR